nr:PREDICTED: protein phosphatase 1K, mitochondrial isoform X2 [Lepisosteus oculatus]
MSVGALINLLRPGGLQVRRRALLTTSRRLQEDRHHFHCVSPARLSNSRFDPDGSGRPTTWDAFGIWDNRIDEPILMPSSIKYGKPIPKVSVSKVGCASQIGKRRENEDRFQVSQMTENVLYFAVYDGHGGPVAADFCNKFMEKYIQDLVAEEENLEVVLAKAFLEIDKALARHVHLSADGEGVQRFLTWTTGRFLIFSLSHTVVEMTHAVVNAHLPAERWHHSHRGPAARRDRAGGGQRGGQPGPAVPQGEGLQANGGPHSGEEGREGQDKKEWWLCGLEQPWAASRQWQAGHDPKHWGL